MKRLRLVGTTCLVAISLIFLLSPISTFAKTHRVIVGSPFPPMQVINRTIIKPWVDEINRRSKGKIKMKYYPGGSLGKTPAHYDLAEKGVAHVGYHLTDYTPGRFPMTSVFSLPFMTPSAKITSEAMWRTFEQEPDFRKEYSKVKLLAIFCHPGGDFHTVSRPIRKLDDFKGLKIRSANGSVNQALQIWGAVPVSMPITETYLSMERRVVDGTVLPWEGMGVFKLSEITKYATVTGFYTMPHIIVMNKKKWNSLPKDMQKLIDDTTGFAMSSRAGAEFDATTAPFRKMALDKGIEEIILPVSELQKLKDLTKPMRITWIKDMEKRGLNGKQVLKTALRNLGLK